MFSRRLCRRNPSLGGRQRGARSQARDERRKGGKAPLRENNVIDEELKAILVCPACKGDLIFEETRIICPACRKAYPIRDDIPVMLIDEAQPWAPAS